MKLLPPSQKVVSAIENILSRFQSKLYSQPVLLSNSAQNENFRVETEKGPLFVRIYSNKLDLESIQREHEVLLWAAHQGLPVILPLALPEGATLLCEGDFSISVFPWVEGRLKLRGSLTEEDAFIFGEMQGRLHKALADYPAEDLPENLTGSFWDTNTTYRTLERIETEVQKQCNDPEVSGPILEGIWVQKSLLDVGCAQPVSAFAKIPRQPVHGDYHDGNVLFRENGQVLAVVDWEMVGRLPKIFELVRMLSFSRMVEEPLIGSYLQGYRSWVDITEDECEASIEMWWQSILHDTWALQNVFLDGNHRALKFLPYARERVRMFSKRKFREHLVARMLRLTPQ